MLEIRTTAGWALMTFCLILALIWLITLFSRVRPISWFCVLGAPVAFGLGDELLQPSGIGFFPFIITVLVLAFIPAVITGTVESIQNQQMQKKQRKQEREDATAREAAHREMIRQMRQSEKYRHMKNCLLMLLKEDIVHEVTFVSWKSDSHGVRVLCTGSAPPYRWDAASGEWVIKPTKTVYFFERRPSERAYTFEEREIIKGFMNEIMERYADKSVWKKSEIVSGWYHETPTGYNRGDRPY